MAEAKPQGVTWIKNTDRYTQCHSCRANAAVVLLADGWPAFATCMRHLRLNADRTCALVGKPRCDRKDWHFGAECGLILTDAGECPRPDRHAKPVRHQPNTTMAN